MGDLIDEKRDRMGIARPKPPGPAKPKELLEDLPNKKGKVDDILAKLGKIADDSKKVADTEAAKRPERGAPQPIPRRAGGLEAIRAPSMSGIEEFARKIPLLGLQSGGGGPAEQTANNTAQIAKKLDPILDAVGKIYEQSGVKAVPGVAM